MLTSMNEQDIIAKIDEKVKRTTIGGEHPPLSKKYPEWYIGITNDPEKRRAWHETEKGKKKVKLWEDWQADSKDIASRVEKHFLDLGMDGGEGGSESPTHVYIY